VETGNRGYIKLDGSLWVNAIPAQDTLQILINSNAGINMNSGRIIFPYAIDGITIQNEYNDVSTRSVTYTGSLNNASDPALKERIHDANLEICYQTLATIPLRVYNYVPAYESTFRVRDRSRLGFLTSEVAPVFPNSISRIPFEHSWANSTIETLDTSQIKYAHLGATQHLIQQVSTLEATAKEQRHLLDRLRRLATQRNVIH
jgi:hypothetical protein